VDSWEEMDRETTGGGSKQSVEVTEYMVQDDENDEMGKTRMMRMIYMMLVTREMEMILFWRLHS
jgi:hypothetical protein